MATQPFFASRDPSIAQSIYNLGHAFLGPDARRREAQDAMDARVADARIRNYDSDTGFNVERTRGTKFTNDARAAVGEATAAYQRDPSPENLARLQAISASFAENPEQLGKAFRNLNSIGRFNAGDRRGAGLLMGDSAAASPDFAGTDEQASALRAEAQRGRESLNNADLAGAMERARLEAENRLRIAQNSPVIANDGSTVLFAPNDPRIPSIVPAERPAPVIQPGPSAGTVPTLPPAVPPPQAPSAPATLGTAFATQGQAPVVQGNTVRVPANQPAGRQADPVAEEARRVALFKSRTDARADVAAALATQLTGMGLNPADIDSRVANGIIDAAVRNAEAAGFQTDANTALAGVISQLGLGTNVDDGWLWDTTTLARNGQKLDDNGVQALIRDTMPKISADNAGKAMFDRLPSGTRFLDPNGIERIKP